MISGRLQSDEHGVGVNLDVGFHRESFPEQIKKISIHRGGGGLANFVVLANSKLTGFTAVSYFFTLTRDEPKKSLPPVSGMQASMPDVLSVFVTAVYPRSECEIVHVDKAVCVPCF